MEDKNFKTVQSELKNHTHFFRVAVHKFEVRFSEVEMVDVTWRTENFRTFQFA